MPFTLNKGFSVPATASSPGTWGSDGSMPTANASNALNEGVTQLLDQQLGGTTTLSLSSTNVTMTQLQCQNGMLRCTGTLTGNIVISPGVGVLWNGIYCWENVTTGNFSVTIQNSAGSVALPQGRRGLMWLDAVNGPRVIAVAGSSTADPVPAGSVVPFYNVAAPAGYTVVSMNDHALQIVSSLGGSTTGSVDYSTVFGRVATDAHAITVAQMPSHAHNFTRDATLAGQNSFTVISGIQTSGGSATVTTQSTGGGNGHTHGMDLRIKTARVILGTRN